MVASMASSNVAAPAIAAVVASSAGPRNASGRVEPVPDRVTVRGGGCDACTARGGGGDAVIVRATCGAVGRGPPRAGGWDPIGGRGGSADGVVVRAGVYGAVAVRDPAGELVDDCAPVIVRGRAVACCPLCDGSLATPASSSPTRVSDPRWSSGSWITGI